MIVWRKPSTIDLGEDSRLVVEELDRSWWGPEAGKWRNYVRLLALQLIAPVLSEFLNSILPLLSYRAAGDLGSTAGSSPVEDAHPFCHPAEKKRLMAPATTTKQPAIPIEVKLLDKGDGSVASWTSGLCWFCVFSYCLPISRNFLLMM
jgi:hypothetical protein